MTLRYLLPFRPPTNFDEVNADLDTLIDNMEKTIEGAKDHSQLTGVTADQHHAKLHQVTHQQGGGDTLTGTLTVHITGNADTVDSYHVPCASAGGNTSLLRVGAFCLLAQRAVFNITGADWYSQTVTWQVPFDTSDYQVVVTHHRSGANPSFDSIFVTEKTATNFILYVHCVAVTIPGNTWFDILGVGLKT